MNTIAFIPVRYGSKSIARKNIKIFCGKPLVYWNLIELEKSPFINQIVVASDSEEVLDIVRGFNFNKVKLYRRNFENAQDHSTSEDVMIEYIDYARLSNSDIFMLVQATSPFTQSEHFNGGLEMMKEYDSVLSCTLSNKFTWNEEGEALNYDINKRPRRQNYKGNLIENGAFYINTVGNIKMYKNRISGNIGIYKMPSYSSVEVDEPLDWLVAEQVMRDYVLKKKTVDISNIKILFSDVDGVLTDSGMYYSENGDELKKFSAYDGMAFKLLQENGIKVGIITTEDRDLNRRRAKKLNLDYDFHGIDNKLAHIKQLCIVEKISLSEIAYIGDDINCFDLLSNVGLAACPSNAMNKIKAIPNIICLSKSGGEGVIRELFDSFYND